MGNGNWSTDVYSARSAAKQAAGQSTFHYNDDVLAKLAHDERRVHDRLNPQGVTLRESCDSDEHPESNAIAVAFDVTSSMGKIPRILQQKLPKLHGLIQRRGYIEHPQVLFAGIGDSYTDRAPLQVGQFESDNRMEEDLEHIWLEGGGGGQMREGYEMMLWFLARKTKLDCFTKRGKKGYAFIVGDELSYPAASVKNIEKIFGEGAEADVPLEQLIAEVQERYELFFIMAPSNSYGRYDEILGAWRDLLGERALKLDDPAAVCEAIALAIGLNEGVIDLDSGLDDLDDFDTDEATRQAAGTAVAAYASSRPRAAVAVGAGAGATAVADEDEGGVDRL